MQQPSNQVPLAVIGLGCRLPGADNLDEYWQLIRDGRSGIVSLPPERLDRSLYFDLEQGKIGRTYSQIGGVVPERPLRREVCALPQELIDNSDAAHQIMCEVAAMACRHAGYDPFDLPQRNVGVYVGHSGGSCLSGELATSVYVEEVAHYLQDVPQFCSLPADTQFATIKNIVDRVHREKAKRRPDGGPDLAAYQVAGLVSQAFRLQGPFLAVDAACASSLIAMAIGCHALRQGFIDMAIVGGASYSKWYGLVLFSMAQSISGTGSRPFDANADGLISSDGYAAVILKTLPKALADGDKIYSVIRGVGISSDGRGKSLWAPRKEGQIKAIHRAYGPDVDPAELQYIECHATSTQVGDATELGALSMALKDRLPPDRKLPIGSVKANIGHTLESAGIAGFVKTVLCMQNRMLPGQINFQTPNPDVDWANIPFEVNRQTRAWPEPPAGRARRAAVNAFGIGGLNVHVVIDDAPNESLKKQFRIGGAAPSQTNIAAGDQDDRSVAIVGRAAILPGALTLDAYWDLLVSGRDPKSDVPPARWNKNIYRDGKDGANARFKTALGGFVNDFVYDWKKHKVPPKQINNANPLQFMLLDAADQAIRESGYDQKPFDRTKTAVIVGSCFGGDFACQLQMGLRIPEFQMHLREELQQRGIPANQIEAVADGYQDALLKHMPALLDETGSFTASTLASRLTKTFDMMGGALAMDAGDTSSLAAIHASAGLLLDGAADMVLCAAGQRNMDLNVYEIYEMKGLLASGPTKAAYDVDGGKLVPAEGVGVVLLKRLKDAQRDGDRIFGIIRGIAAATNFGEYPDNFRAAAQRVLTATGVDPAQVSVLESARFSATIADVADLHESAEIFGSEHRVEPIVMNSVVGQIGYSLGTAGMASVLKASLEMQHGQVPRNPLVTQPLPDVAELSDAVQVADQPRPLYATRPGGKTIASVVNCATNGATYQLLLEGGENLPQPPQKPRRAAPTSSVPLRTIRLGAPSRDVLFQEVSRIIVNPESLFQTGGRDHFNGQDRVRLTVLAEDAAALGKKLRLTTEMVQRPGTRMSLEQQGIFLQDVGQQVPKIAFLFPGQGSQYAGMLQQLVAEVPAAAEKVRELNGILTRLGHGTVEDICWKQTAALGNDVWTTQLSMLIANTLMHHVLGTTGIRADVISGHSYGEIPALVAAGVLTLEDAIQVTKVRTESVESQESTRGSLLSTTAPIDVVKRLLSQRSGVHLASHNAPDQCVVGGTHAGVADIKSMLESAGFGCKVLSVPRPYHTPLLHVAKDAFQSALSRIAFRTPAVKFFSSVTNEYVTSGDDARRNLVEQLTTPVYYVDLVRKLATDGITIFIEVGPQQVLTRLNQRNLTDYPASALAADMPRQPGRAPIERIRTLLETASAQLTPAVVSTATAPLPQKATVNASRIVFFDATARRRRQQNGSPATAPVVAAAVSQAMTQPAVVQPSAVSAVLNRDEVLTVMVNFVVDQTGYPAEMVELDADLEADLGIDSIKKAQLIGELAENYELTHLAGQLQNLSLDDFRTLRSILDFVVDGGSGKAEGRREEVGAAELGLEVLPALSSQPSAPSPSSNGHSAAALNPQPSTLNRDEVQVFMINFVVDQTGYPAEMVELDADLEADLGIDSIKKAQLIGELAENYELTHLASGLQNLSLDDFRTLRSILDFVVDGGSAKAEGGSDDNGATAAESPVVPAQSPQPVTLSSSDNGHSAVVLNPQLSTLNRDEVEATMVNFVVDQTGYPAEMVELDADLEADLGIDSIKKAQLIGELAENYELTHLASSLQNLSLDDFRTLRSILDFVVAGGSGKAEGGSDDNGAAAAESAAAPVVPALSGQPSAFSSSASTAVATLPAVVVETQPATSDVVYPEGFNLVQGHGSAYEIGKQHGANQAVQIRTIMERYASMLGPRLQNIPELEEALAQPTLYFCEDDLEELHGIADGSGLPIPAVVAHNLGMYPDYVPGCTQFAVTARNNSNLGLIHAVNEDSPLSLTLPDCLSRVVQVRMPRGRIPHVTFSVSGQAGGLNGMNAMGIAVSSTLLLDRPRRAGSDVGKVHPVIVKRILERASTIEDAVEIVKSLDRVGAWSLCISHYPTDRLCYLEYDGKSLAVQENPPFVLTTNHCLLQPPVADVPEHSKHRLARLHQLLGERADGRWTLERAQKTLRDQFDLGRGRQTAHATMNTVRRVDNQISVVMLPSTGELWVTPGPRAGARQDEYFRFNVQSLFKEVVAADQSGELSAEKIVLNSAALRDGLPTEAQHRVQRHVMRTVAAPLPPGTADLPPLHGAVLILGEAKVGETLKARLQEAGAQVYELPIANDVDATLNELNRIWALGPAPHLFITTAREEGAVVTEIEWPERTQRAIQVPYFVCQRWTQLVQEAGLTKRATLTGLTALGGDFGFSGRIVAIEGGGLTGLFKAIRREIAGLTVKLIDSPMEEAPAQLAACVLKELAGGTPQTEVGYQRGERLLPRAVPQPASTQRRAVKVPHGNWVVTGGARGVTAVVARELAKRFGLTMQLLGSTPLPNIDPTWRNLTDEGLKALKRTTSEQSRAAGKNPAQAWKEVERAIEIDRTLQAFRADGVKAVYHACDVTDRESLSATLDRIRESDGPIHGIIHGAGVESACKFEKKKRENVLATLAVKVDAAMALLDLTAFDPVGWFIGFGSTSGRFGGLGQTDYSLASDLLCKICDWAHLRRPDTASVGFHWPPWADVGMASRPESKIALQSGGLVFMPPLEGVAHVIDEVSTLMLEGEILCIDKPDLLDQDGTMDSPAEREGYRQRDSLLRSVSLIDGIHHLEGDRKLTATARLNPRVEPFLLEHRHQGVPILPAVCGMELMAEAALLLNGKPQKAVTIKNMTVHQGFRFHTHRPQTAQVWTQKQAGGIRCELRADFLDRNGRLVEPHRLQMDATIELAEEYSPLPKVDLGPAPTSWKTHMYADDWQTMKYPDDGRVYHGYPFRGIKEYAIVENGMWGRVTVPLVSDIVGERDVDGWLLPSATIDAALLGCDILLWNTIRSARLPLGFERIRIARPLQDGEPLMYRVWLRPDNHMIADFVMVDANGQVVIHAEAFQMVEIKQGMGVVGRAELAPGANIPGTPGFIERRAFPRPEHATRVIAGEDVGQLPLIDSARWINDRELYAEVKFDPVADVFLAQHRLAGRPILPAVIGMESMIEAASLALPGKSLGSVTEFVIARGMRFKTDDPQSARVKVRMENGKARCELVGGENLDVVMQSALIEMCHQPPVITAAGPGRPPFPYNPMMYPEEGQLVHGKLFRALKQLILQRDGGWASVAGYPVNNMQGNRRGDNWFLPPAVFDSCLVACGVDMFVMSERRMEVPYACEEFKLGRLPLPKEQCVLRLYYRGHDERHTTYDFTLYGADGAVILTVKRYRGIVTGLDGDSSHWDGKNTLLD